MTFTSDFRVSAAGGTLRFPPYGQGAEINGLFKRPRHEVRMAKPATADILLCATIFALLAEQLLVSLTSDGHTFYRYNCRCVAKRKGDSASCHIR